MEMSSGRARGMFEVDSFYTQGFLSGDGLSIPVDGLPLLRRPIDQYRLANYVFKRQELPLVRVPGVVAIISQDEQLPLGNDPIAVIGRRTGNVRLREGD